MLHLNDKPNLNYSLNKVNKVKATNDLMPNIKASSTIDQRYEVNIHNNIAFTQHDESSRKVIFCIKKLSDEKYLEQALINGFNDKDSKEIDTYLQDKQIRIRVFSLLTEQVNKKEQKLLANNPDLKDDKVLNKLKKIQMQKVLLHQFTEDKQETKTNLIKNQISFTGEPSGIFKRELINSVIKPQWSTEEIFDNKVNSALDDLEIKSNLKELISDRLGIEQSQINQAIDEERTNYEPLYSVVKSGQSYLHQAALILLIDDLPPFFLTIRT